MPSLAEGHRIGIKYPQTKRKRTIPGATTDEIASSILMDVCEIDALTRKTADLNRRVMKGLLERLYKHKVGVIGANA